MDNYSQLLDSDNFDDITFGEGSEARTYATLFKVIIDDNFYAVVKALNPVIDEEEDGAFVLYLNPDDKSISQVQDPDILTIVFDEMMDEDYLECENEEEQPHNHNHR